jgi:hypothetical protein
MFKKSLLSITILTLTLTNLSAVVYYPKDIDAQEVRTAKKDFALDIHNVLVQKESSRLGKTFAEVKKYACAFTHAPLSVLTNAGSYFWAKMWGTQNAVTHAMTDMKNLPKSVDSSGEAYATICRKHQLYGLAAFIEQVSNAYKPRPGMTELVQQLHEKGFTQRLASNIGPRLLALLDHKFTQEYNCNMFEHIQMGKIVDYSKYGNPESAPLIDSTYMATAGKPELEFFTQFNETYPLPAGMYRIFIDDKIENINAALAAGWVGIHFDITNKNVNPVEELLKDLAAVGITL